MGSELVPKLAIGIGGNAVFGRTAQIHQAIYSLQV